VVLLFVILEENNKQATHKKEREREREGVGNIEK
jgi:hypothetical protein